MPVTQATLPQQSCVTGSWKARATRALIIATIWMAQRVKQVRSMYLPQSHTATERQRER